MSNLVSRSRRFSTYSVAVAMLTLASLGANANPPEGIASDAPSLNGPSTVHGHGPVGKRWIHRRAHPVLDIEMRRSIRPKQYGSPGIHTRSRVR